MRVQYKDGKRVLFFDAIEDIRDSLEASEEFFAQVVGDKEAALECRRALNSMAKYRQSIDLSNKETEDIAEPITISHPI